MNPQQLRDIAKALLAGDKGLLAMDESNPTCNKRFAKLGIPQTEEARRRYRELIVTTPHLGECISGVILYDETIRQQRKDGTLFVKVITDAGIIPGIKVDTGAKDMAGHPGEKVTEGLDGLRDRLTEYSQMAARFAKWRAVIAIGVGIPSRSCIEANAHVLARYAALCQEAGLVPVVEPEVLMDGDHVLERCREVTEKVLRNVFIELNCQRVLLEGMILKPNMVLPGLTCPAQESVDEVADVTVRSLLRTVPAAVPGIAFLSGGQSSELASARLNAMNVRFKSRLPWALAFSFARAIQQPALEIWRGQETNVLVAQEALYHRAKCNWAARRGEYDAAMEATSPRNPRKPQLNKESIYFMKPNVGQSNASEPNPSASAESKPRAPTPGSGAKPNAKPDPKEDLKTLPLAEVEKKLDSSPDGLTQAEAQKRLTQYGPNELVEKKTNLFLKFLSYFWGPIPWMIEVAVILSGVVGHWPDFFIILLLLVANAVVGFWEERQAGNAIEALKAKLAIKARVKRDGKWINPPARELVPGDVIRMRLGDIVPADARLFEGDPVEVDQSALTGESLPAERKSGEAVFSGSIIRRGEIGALVYATGEKTYFGRTAQLVQEAHTVSHFQKAVLKIGNYLIILAVALVAIIITVAIFRGDPILSTLQFALVLTVAAIPVAMPTVLSVTMAVGARLLAKKQAIVSKLVAIEELAGVDVLCADKTGTLTQNKLTLGDPFNVNNVPGDQVILSGALASRADNNDTIDLAVLGGLKDKDSLKAYEVVHFQPFDPVHKRTEATVKGKDGKTFKVTKGAPQVILQLAANAGQVKPAVEKAVNEFAARGFRALGVARADGDGQWNFLGVLPLFDPPREDAKATIATALAMGVKVKMVTGDALAIAKETASKLGMGTNILDAASLGDSKKQETKEVAESIEKADGFAQVFPEHKFHIVDVLQKRGHIVGMTGDGVNDAPALKKADCGIAVSGATDAARAAAAIVLMTPGLSVIIDAIKESRRIFQRMNSYAIYRIAETLRVLFFMTLAILIFNFYPLTAVMIVMLALLNDGAILSIAYDNVHYKDKPEAWNMRMVLGVSTALGVIGVVSAFGLFYLGERVFKLDRAHIQTLMYLKLSVAGHLTIFLTRTRGPFWSIRPAKILWIAVLGTQIVATLIAVYGLFMTPLGWGWAGFVWGYALLWFLVNDRIKLLAYRIFDPVKAVAKSETEPEVKAKAQTEKRSMPPPSAKVETKSDPKAETKPEAKASPGAKDKKVSDLTPQIATRAYEIYERQGHRDGQSVQNWDKAEREIRATQAKVEPKAEIKPAAKTESEPETKAQPGPDANSKPEARVEPAPATQAEPKPDTKPKATPEPKPGAKTEPAPEMKAPTTSEVKAVPPSEAKTESEPDTKPKPNVKPVVEVSPQLVNRVHEFYEQLGREDVRAVEEADQAKQKTPEVATKK